MLFDKRHLRVVVIAAVAASSSFGCSAADANDPPTTGSTSQADTVDAGDAGATTRLTSCTTITSPGNYVLDTDVTGGSASGACIAITNTSGVTLDCANHAIVSNYGMLSVTNTSTFTVQNCHFEPGSLFQQVPAVTVSQSSSGNLLSNVTGATATASMPEMRWNVDHSNWIAVLRNTFYGEYDQQYTTHSIVDYNQFTCITPTCAGLVTSSTGYSNSISQNTMDGRAVGTEASGGADDGIVIDDESSDAVYFNRISNTWDTGIETSGFVSSSAFNFNTLTNVGFAGIGGWYHMSMAGNTIASNDISRAQYAFVFYRVFGLRPAAEGRSADTGVLFRYNDFAYNVFRNSTLQTPQSMAILFQVGTRYMGFDGTVLPGETVPAASQFYMSNNTFQYNDLGTDTAPPNFGTVVYPGAVVDDGNNTCAQGTAAGYPLTCIGTPACAGLTAAGQATSPSIGVCCTAEGPTLCHGGDGRACVDRANTTSFCQVQSCPDTSSTLNCVWTIK